MTQNEIKCERCNDTGITTWGTDRNGNWVPDLFEKLGWCPKCKEGEKMKAEGMWPFTK